MSDRKEVKAIVSSLYHRHDLGIKTHDKKIEKITDLIMEDVEKYPEIKVSKYMITQIILENF